MKKIVAFMAMISVVSFDSTAQTYLRTNDGASIMWELGVNPWLVADAISDLLSQCNATELSDAPSGGKWREYWNGNFVGSWSTLSWLDAKNLTRPSPSFENCSEQIADQAVHESGWVPVGVLIGLGVLFFVLAAVGGICGIGRCIYDCCHKPARHDDGKPIDQIDTGSLSEASLESVQ